ncbi:MAG: hypothetical protein CMB80_03810 [Flammeovirgaceae bacterium]|nr:hypothetical protein [Flammeovirgaceae bacterium]
MSVVYPGLVNVDNSPITVTTINVYDDNQRTHTYDLSDQFPAWGGSLELTDSLQVITLPSPARVNTLIIVLDGLTLSPQLIPGGDGDYIITNSTTVTLNWGADQLPKRHGLNDTPVLLARYTLA